MSTPKEPLLFFAAWWPTSGDPMAGIFIREHALALAPMFDVHVVHLTIEKRGWKLPSTHIEHEASDGLNVHRVHVQTPLRRFGIHDALVKAGYEKVVIELMRSISFQSYVINVRSHLTALIPEVKALAGLPFILIEHFSYYHRVLPTLSANEQKEASEELKRWFALPALKRILVVSERLGAMFNQEFGVPLTKIARVYNVAASPFNYIEHKHDPEKIRLLAAAKWEVPKRPDLLIDAAELASKRIPFIELHVYGSGSLIDLLRDRIGSLPTSIEVQLHGFSSKDDIARSMQRADLLVHPSDAENAPTVISEALCCGLPIVSMDIGGIPEMIEPNDGLLVKPGDASSLSDAVVDAYQRLQEFDRAAISKRALSKYSASAVGEALSSEIRSLSNA